MQTLRYPGLRGLPVILLLSLLLGACAAPTPLEPTPAPVERPTGTPVPSPTTFSPDIALSTNAVTPGDVLENVPVFATPTLGPTETPWGMTKTPTPRPGLSLTTDNPPADVKQILQEYPSFIILQTGGKLLPPEDTRCANADLLDFDVLLFQSTKWQPGDKIKVSANVPAGKSQSTVVEADDRGVARVAYQPGAGAHGTYVFLLDNGKETRKCSFIYLERKTAGLYLISRDPFQPVFDRKNPGSILFLNGFVPYEPARLLVYQTTARPNEWSLLGWQKLKIDSNGQLLLDLGENPENRTYVVFGQKTGEVHLSLPSMQTGLQKELLTGIRAVPPTPTPTNTPIK